MRGIFTTVLLVLLVLPVWGEAGTSCDEKVARSVINALLNWELNRADAIVAQWRQDDPENPSLDLYEAITQVARIDYSPSRDPARFDGVIEQLDNVIKTNRKHSELAPEDAIYRYNLATAQAIAGRLLMEKKHWLKAFFYGRDSRRMMKSLIAEDAEFTDAYLVLGMFDYFTSSFPGIMRWISSLAGFEPSRSNGIAQLEQAVISAKVAGPYAADSLLLEVRHDATSACRYRELARMMKRSYPRNPRYRRMNRNLNALCAQLPPAERPLPVTFRLAEASCPSS